MVSYLVGGDNQVTCRPVLLVRVRVRIRVRVRVRARVRVRVRGQHRVLCILSRRCEGCLFGLRAVGKPRGIGLRLVRHELERRVHLVRVRVRVKGRVRGRGRSRVRARA